MRKMQYEYDITIKISIFNKVSASKYFGDSFNNQQEQITINQPAPGKLRS